MPSSIKIPVVDSLIVTAEAAWETVDGRDEMNTPFIIARVLDQHGAITGLVGADFQVVQMGFEFETVSLISPSSLADPPFEELAPRLGILAGTYKLRLKTNPSRSGQFVFAVVVTAPAPREGVTMRVGQSLVSVVKVK